jgi:pyruvate,water dikinase
MTVTGPVQRRDVEAGSPDFPIAFTDPSHAELTWDWDDMHAPFALAPLAAEYMRTLAGGMNERYERLDFPQRWRVAVWNGYAYFSWHCPGTPAEIEAVVERWVNLARREIEVMGEWWRDEALAELRALYARIAATDVEGLDGTALASAWDDAWAAGRRSWEIHFVAIMAPYQVMDDLADLYERLVPGATAGEAVRLVQGHGDDLFAVDLGLEALAGAAESSPAVAGRLMEGGVVTREELLTLDGGEAFVSRLDAFLAEHGHLGQSVDDFIQASWVEEPSLLLADLAKRMGRPAGSVRERRERLRREADALADSVRARLEPGSDDLAAFERLLAHARDIGPLTEGHNYWIDRMAQSRLRVLSTRVGRRLAAEGSIEDPADVFYLEHADITAALVSPRDLRTTVADRKAAHARQLAIVPPRTIGAAREEASAPDRFDGARLESTDPNQLLGTGASAGVVRGTARVVLANDQFGRIQPGDVIVCPSSNPSWIPVFSIAGGLVTNTGGVLSHAAVVARELGLPAVVGVADATAHIADGRLIEIDGGRGIVSML